MTCGPLAFFDDRLDDRADAIADRVVFRARLFLARNLRFDAADFRDDVAALESLDGGVDDLADPLAELAVNLLALGFAHALGDDLLGGLRRDAAELLGFLRELDLHPDFGFFAVELLRLVERDLACRVRDLGHDLPHRVELDLAGLEVEAGPQILVALEDLARGREIGVFDRADDDGRVDALVLRHDVDHLLQFSSHVSSSGQSADGMRRQTPNSTSSRARLIRPSGTRCTRRPSEQHVVAVHSRQPARKMRLAVHRLGRHDLGQPAGESPIVGLAARAADPDPATTPRGCSCRSGSPTRSGSTSSSALRSWLTRWQSSIADRLFAPVPHPASDRRRRSMITRRTQPIDSRRNCRSKISSP